MKRSAGATLLASLMACTSPSESSSSSSSSSSGSSSSSSSSSSGGSSGGAAHNPLWIPPVVTGTTFDLALSDATRQFLPGAASATMGYNGAEFWGPTLVMNKGDMVQLNVTNNLADHTTTHWHGMHIPAVMDGGPHQIIDPGTTWSPFFEVKNKAGTFWYHPHAHHTTKAQLAYGAGGFIIVKDAEEAALALPRTYGVDDVPVVLSSRRFNSTNQFDLTASYGDVMLANGVLDAEATLPRQVVRLRILNAETERSYELGFSDNRTFHVIGADGGLLNVPVAVTRVPLYVGERVEILVDLSQDAVGSVLDMRAFNGGHEFGFPGGEPGTTGEFGSLLNNTTFDVLHIKVGASTENPITAIPATLAQSTFWTEADATVSRTLHITDMGPGTPFTFDGVGFDETVINQTIVLNTVEKWTISNGNTFNHSFHIHDVQFRIVSRSDGPVPAYEQGWKDTVSIARNQSVTFVARFDDFSDATHPYMYHCHMANHEDGGTMGQFIVN